MDLHKAIPELVDAGIISKEKAKEIQRYYKDKKKSSTNGLYIVFGILGALLIGLGIILVLAHNWEALSKMAKLAVAFAPMMAGQFICLYVLLKRRNSVAWREGGAAFLFFAVGACLALVGQIYHIPSELSEYLLTWMILCIPIVYVMPSSVVSLLYMLGISYYAGESGYWGGTSAEPYWYWVLLALALPHYYMLIRHQRSSNFTLVHHWLFPISITIALGTIAQHWGELMYVAYFSLFGLFQLIGVYLSKKQSRLSNGYVLIGLFGTVILLLISSFRAFWKHLRDQDWHFGEVANSSEFIVAVVLTLIVIGFYTKKAIGEGWRQLKLREISFLFFGVIFIIGLYSPIASVFVNLLALAIGLQMIRQGLKQSDLAVLNFGLLIIVALIGCRFFATDLSFVIKGLLFISVGIGFFLVNYLMLRKRSVHE